MTVPTLRPVRPPALEVLQRDLGMSYGDDFGTARKLVALIEDAAPLMSELDRRHLARVMSAGAHAILLTCDKREFNR